jgi:hypothetical protein
VYSKTHWLSSVHLIQIPVRQSSRSLPEYLLRLCNECKNTEWNNQSIPLEIEHIDENSENNLLDNTELLCPNCHAQTSTYKNRNMGNG